MYGFYGLSGFKSRVRKRAMGRGRNEWEFGDKNVMSLEGWRRQQHNSLKRLQSDLM